MCVFFLINNHLKFPWLKILHIRNNNQLSINININGTYIVCKDITKNQFEGVRHFECQIIQIPYSCYRKLHKSF